MLSMIQRSMPGGGGIVRMSWVISKPFASLPWMTPINNTGRPVGSPIRYAVMSRPCTDLPMTRVSVTSDGARVVDVVVAGTVEDVVVVLRATVVAADDVVLGSAVAGDVVAVVVDWLFDVD